VQVAPAGPRSPEPTHPGAEAEGRPDWRRPTAKLGSEELAPDEMLSDRRSARRSPNAGANRTEGTGRPEWHPPRGEAPSRRAPAPRQRADPDGTRRNATPRTEAPRRRGEGRSSVAPAATRLPARTCIRTSLDAPSRSCAGSREALRRDPMAAPGERTRRPRPAGPRTREDGATWTLVRNASVQGRRETRSRRAKASRRFVWPIHSSSEERRSRAGRQVAFHGWAPSKD
jgi:hypothetical protein